MKNRFEYREASDSVPIRIAIAVKPDSLSRLVTWALIG